MADLIPLNDDPGTRFYLNLDGLTAIREVAVAGEGEDHGRTLYLARLVFENGRTLTLDERESTILFITLAVRQSH